MIAALTDLRGRIEGGEAAQVLLLPRQARVGVFHLHRQRPVLPLERAAEDGMPLHESFPRLPECGRVERLTEGCHHLLNVHPGMGSGQVVVQHALLNGRQRNAVVRLHLGSLPFE